MLLLVVVVVVTSSVDGRFLWMVGRPGLFLV